MKPWAMVDEDALELLFPHMPRPWPDEVAAAWLRYSHAAAQHGRCYWLAEDATAQVVAAMRRRDPPGRVALSQVTGWTEKRARILLERATWIDPIQVKRQSAEAAGGGRAGAGLGPSPGRAGAGLRLINGDSPVAQGPALGLGGAGVGPGWGPYARVSLEPRTQNPEPNTPPNPPAVAGVGCAEPEEPNDRHPTPETAAPVPAPVADRDSPSPLPPPPAPARPRKGLSPADRATLAATVLEVAGPVEGVPPSVYDGPIRRLHRVLGSPDLAGLCLEVALVGQWARESGEPRAARYIRGIGMGGADQSRSVKTLCDPDRWGERLQAARAWNALKTSTSTTHSSGPSAAEEAYREACIEALLDGAPEEGLMAPIPRGLDEGTAMRARDRALTDWWAMVPSMDRVALEASREAWRAARAEETRQQLKAMGLGPAR